jgi:hypothetical protein
MNSLAKAITDQSQITYISYISIRFLLIASENISSSNIRIIDLIYRVRISYCYRISRRKYFVISDNRENFRYWRILFNIYREIQVLSTQFEVL